MKIHTPTKADVLLSLQRLYPGPDFVAIFQSIPNAQVFVYGGLLRDLALHKQAKEADIVVMSQRPIEELERLAEKILGQSGFVMQGKVGRHNKRVNYHYLPPGKTSLNSIIDINLQQGLKQPASDFSINNLYLNLISGEFIDRHNGLGDLEQGILRSVESPDKAFKKKPLHIFRAIKCVCQFGLQIDPPTREGIKNNAALTVKTLAFVADNQQTLLGEWMLDNIFRGLAYNPKLYFSLCQELGVLHAFLLFLSKRLKKPYSLVKALNFFPNPFVNKTKKHYEYNLSLFLSFLVDRLTVSGREKLFNQLVKLFGFSLPNKYHPVGINSLKMRYHSA